MSGGHRPSYGGFREFLTKSNALALAIGVIIGAALGSVVNSLVKDVIMPPIGWALGGVDFSQLKYVLGTNAAGEEVAVNWGLFVNNVITFLIVALVVYVIATMFVREPPPDEIKTCPFCKEANSPDASKCRACTSAI
jgi:large conductance mechanosensitive channel